MTAKLNYHHQFTCFPDNTLLHDFFTCLVKQDKVLYFQKAVKDILIIVSLEQQVFMYPHNHNVLHRLLTLH